MKMRMLMKWRAVGVCMPTTAMMRFTSERLTRLTFNQSDSKASSHTRVSILGRFFWSWAHQPQHIYSHQELHTNIPRGSLAGWLIIVIFAGYDEFYEFIWQCFCHCVELYVFFLDDIYVYVCVCMCIYLALAPKQRTGNNYQVHQCRPARKEADWWWLLLLHYPPLQLTYSSFILFIAVTRQKITVPVAVIWADTRVVE